MKYTLESTIPTMEYGNIRQTVEMDSPEQEEEAVSIIKGLWNRFGEKGLKDRSDGGVKVETFTGETILWNESTHTYTDLAGNILLSGSKYADEHSPKFDLDMMAPKTAKAWDVSESELREIWKFNGDISTSWGTAIHKALELYHRFNGVGGQIQNQKELDNNYVLPKNTTLLTIVNSFIEKYGAKALPEVLVSDVANKRAGTIDRLEILSDGHCRIGDYKTNVDMDDKKKLKYQKQLSFYAHILMAKGWGVEGLDLYWLNQDNEWEHSELEVLDLEE